MSTSWASAPAPGAVFAPDFAIHNGRLNRILDQPIGRVNRWIYQKTRTYASRVSKYMFRQATIAVMRESAGGEMLQFTTKLQAALGQLVGVESAAAPRAAQSERLIQ